MFSFSCLTSTGEKQKSLQDNFSNLNNFLKFSSVKKCVKQSEKNFWQDFFFFVELNEDIKEKHFLMSGNEEINIPKTFSLNE